jgi:thymidylate synthase (FAD)
MKVELVTKSIGVGKYEHLDPDEIIAAIARHSTIKEDNGKLVKYLIDHAHWSPLEHVHYTFYIETSRGISAQIMRHWTLHAQEWCVSGDTEIWFTNPSGQINKHKIKDLYEKFHKGAKPIPSKKITYDKDKIESLKNNKYYTPKELSVIFEKSQDSIRTRINYNNIEKKYYTKHNYKIKGKNFKNSFKKDLSFRIPMSNRIKSMGIRIYDENKKEFTTSNIKDIFYNGQKDVYKVKLKCGRSIKCTLSHKFYHNGKYVCLKDLKKGDIVSTNGVPVYQSKDWMILKKEESIQNKKGIQYIAEEAGVSYHTIRKWLKKHNLKYTKYEAASYRKIWNAGKSGTYNLPSWSKDKKLERRKNQKRGSEHHSWKGGGRNERKHIQDYINSRRQDIYNNYEGIPKCNNCGKENCLIELHHKIEVTRNPYLAYDLNNIEPLCKNCHLDIHKKLRNIPHEKIYNLDNFDWPSIRPLEVKESIKNNQKLKFYKEKKSYKGVTLNKKTSSKKTIGYSEIESITYVGVEDVYDLEVDNSNHNYVANGILVHNSTRYSKSNKIDPIEFRLEHKTNRQSSTRAVGWINEDFSVSFNDCTPQQKKAILKASNALENINKVYEELIESGVAKETARSILPMCTKTYLHMTGNLRDWLSFLNVRCDHHAQQEIREIATAIGEQLEKHHPKSFENLNWRGGMFMFAKT